MGKRWTAGVFCQEPTANGRTKARAQSYPSVQIEPWATHRDDVPNESIATHPKRCRSGTTTTDHKRHNSTCATGRASVEPSLGKKHTKKYRKKETRRKNRTSKINKKENKKRSRKKQPTLASSPAATTGTAAGQRGYQPAFRRLRRLAAALPHRTTSAPMHHGRCAPSPLGPPPQAGNQK